MKVQLTYQKEGERGSEIVKMFDKLLFDKVYCRISHLYKTNMTCEEIMNDISEDFGQEIYFAVDVAFEDNKDDELRVLLDQNHTEGDVVCWDSDNEEEVVYQLIK